MKSDSVNTQRPDPDVLREDLIRRRLAGGRRGRTAIGRADRSHPLPLSFGQERMWFLNRLEPESPEYLVPLVLRLRGSLDVAALRHAAEQMMVRHEIFRTRCELDGTRPVQVIDAPEPFALPFIELTDLPGPERERRAFELARRHTATPFDVEREHPVRLRLVRLSADDHVLIVVFHHIACDDWSVGLFTEELSEFYRAAVELRAPGLPPLPVQYADYAVWQRERLSGELLERRLGYWREHLAGLSPLELPTDRPRPLVRDWVGDRYTFTVPGPLARHMRDLGHRHDATLFVVMLTAFQVLLSRYTGRCDVAVGSAAAGRSRHEEQCLIGFLLNTVVMRARWDGDPAFTDLLRRNRLIALDALDHQEAPIQRLVDDLDPHRDLSRRPLFQVMFDLLETSPPAFDLPGLDVEAVDVVGTIAKFDLTLQLGDMPDGSLFGVLEYATALFDLATVERIAGHYLRLLESVAAEPESPLSELELLDADEQRRLITEPNQSRAPRPWRTVPEAVAQRAAAEPDAVAVTAGRFRLTYAELDARANQIAHHLRELGVGPESVVGVCLRRGPDLLPALLAVWKAGGAYVPLDPTHPPERIAYVLADSGAEVVVTESDHAHLVTLHPGTHVLVDRDRAVIDAYPSQDLARPIDPDALAYLIYTSGSTGRPKGVLISHRGLMNYLEWAVETYAGGHHGQSTTSGCNGAPLFSSIAFDLVVTSLYAPLLTGRSVHVLPPELQAGELGEALAAEGPFAFIKLTPAHLELLTHQLTAEQAAGLTGCLVVGGEGFPTHLLQRWHEHAGGGHTMIVNEYGPTEITVADAAFIAGEPPSSVLLPIGRPMPNTTAYVLDQDQRPVPIGVIGEIHVGGSQLARGYRGLPSLTAERFLPDPFGPPGTRLYRTGDLGRVLSSGDLEFVGRSDDQVKIAGYRIEPGEIEAALGNHPGIRDAVVTAPEDESGARRLVAYVVPVDGVGPAPDELRELLAHVLPPYMIPAAFVSLERIPLTANGKIDYRALPDVGRDSLQPDAEWQAPSSESEERIAAVWADVLGLEKVGVNDNFFDFGGDSLRAVALVGALRDDGLDVAVQDVFEYPTITQLCDLLTTRPQVTPSRPSVRPFELLADRDTEQIPAGVQDAYPLSLVQTGMVFEMLADSGANNYHNTTTYHISDNRPFSLAALRAAAKVVVERHEVLRTSIDLTTYSEPVQLVHDTAELRIEAQDLRHLPASEQDRLVRQCMAEERATLFELSRPSLLRMVVHVCADDRWAATISECHAILEGWSYHLWLMELLDCYRQIRDGNLPEPVEPPAMRFVDFVAAERESLRGDEDRAYWRHTVGEYARFSLPAAWACSSDENRSPYKLEVTFDDLQAGLLALAASAEVPLKSVLHAAHLKVMSMLTDEQAFFTGLVCDARPEMLGADRVLGMFLNTVPFAFRLTAPTWRELARDVFAQEIELWPHRRFPVPAMQRELAGGQRLTEVMFNYLDFRTVDAERVNIHTTIDDSPNEFPLSVTVHRLGVIDLTIQPQVISRANGERLAAMYRLILEAMAAGADGDAQAVYLPAGEHRLLTEEWNDTDVPRSDSLLPELFEARVQATPRAAAVVSAEGLPTTYAQLDERANRLAWYLRGLGVGPETFVGICVEHSVDMLVGLLGVLKAGGAYVPMDSENPCERLAITLADTGASVVVTQQRLRGVLPPMAGRVVCLDRDWAEIAQCPAQRPPREVSPDNLVYAMFTSGSTGRPKGVMITHRGLANYLLWAAEHYGMSGASGAPMLGSIAFDLSIPNLFLPIISGLDVTLLDQNHSTEALAELLRRPGDHSLLKITPAHLDMLRSGLGSTGAVDSVRTYVVGGEELKPETAASWRRLAPTARIINEYGPTETVVGCSVHELGGDHDPAVPVPIGRPIANVRMYVLDSRMYPVPVGVLGELYIGGAGVARGYVNRPDLTAQRFVPDPFGSPGSRLYRSGDLARYRSDGEIEFFGRLDDQVKLRGYRVELGEIEASLLQHPDVDEAVVAVREDQPGARRLVAYLVADSGRRVRQGELIEFLRQTLPSYMIPATFVMMDALPVGRNGKVDRRALPAPGGTRPDHVRPYVAPRTATELLLADLCAQVLDLDRIGAHDNFFELGGDSILTIHLVSAARRAGLPVSPRMILEHPGIAGLAAAADAARHPAAVVAEQALVIGDVPLTPIQRWFLELDTGHDDYHQSVHLTVNPAPDPAVLERALHAVVCHHDTLRLRLTGDRRQFIVPEETATLLRYADLTAVPADRRRAEMERLVAEASAGLDPAHGPMLQAVLFHLDRGQPDELVVAAHRMSVDGVSWQILVPDLATAYQLLAGDEADDTLTALPPKTTSFRHWACRLRDYASSEEMSRQLDHWLSRPGQVALPVDRPGGENSNASADTISAALSEDLTDALLHHITHITAESGVRIREVLLAALARSVARWSGGDSLLVELESHGREEIFDDVDLSRTVGWLTTLFPVALRLPAEDEPAATLAAVVDQLRAIPQRGLGYGALRYLRDDQHAAALAALPKPELCFNYTGRRMDYVRQQSGAQPAHQQFVPVLGETAPARSPLGTRPYLLEIDASIYRGRLDLTWSYSRNLHNEATIRRLADNYVADLATFIEHCATATRRR